jgi:hypothetical protein
MSAQRPSPLALIVSIGVVLTGLMLLLSPRVAAAQCSGDQQSACCTCHAETHPVATQGEWHIQHVERDCCGYCHGGNTQTQDKDLAHVGVVRQPLEDAHLSCHSCHPDDYRTRAAKFAAVLNVTSGSSEPPTPAPVRTTRSASADQATGPQAVLDNGRLALIVALVDAVALGGLGWWSLRLRKRTGV